MKIFTRSNLIVFFRFVFSPLMFPVLIVMLLPYNLFWVNVLLGIVFIGLSIADLFDNYVTKKWMSDSKLVQLLDPVADKFLLYTSLIALLAVNKIFFYWVILLIGRALFIMGVRLVALEKGFSISVSSLWRRINSLVQMMYVAVVIVNPYSILNLKTTWSKLELGLLIVTLGLSFFVAKKYIDAFMGNLPKNESFSEIDIDTDIHDDISY